VEYNSEVGAADSGVERDVGGVPEPERDGVRDKDGEGLERVDGDWTAGSKLNLGLTLLLRMDMDMGGRGPGETGMVSPTKPISRSPSVSTTESISTSGYWPRNGRGDKGKLLVDAKDEWVGESEWDSL